jgi:hypothetical protein
MNEPGLGNEAAFGLTYFQIGMVIAGVLAGIAGAAMVPAHPFLGFLSCLWTVSIAWALYPCYPVISMSFVLMVGGLVVLIR